MKRPRTFYGWEFEGKFYVSVFPKIDGRASNVYATKDDAELDAIKNRTDRGQPGPTIEWESESG